MMGTMDWSSRILCTLMENSHIMGTDMEKIWHVCRAEKEEEVDRQHSRTRDMKCSKLKASGTLGDKGVERKTW